MIAYLYVFDAQCHRNVLILSQTSKKGNELVQTSFDFSAMQDLPSEVALPAWTYWMVQSLLDERRAKAHSDGKKKWDVKGTDNSS